LIAGNGGDGHADVIDVFSRFLGGHDNLLQGIAGPRWRCRGRVWVGGRCLSSAAKASDENDWQ